MRCSLTGMFLSWAGIGTFFLATVGRWRNITLSLLMRLKIFLRWWIWNCSCKSGVFLQHWNIFSFIFCHTEPWGNCTYRFGYSHFKMGFYFNEYCVKSISVSLNLTSWMKVIHDISEIYRVKHVSSNLWSSCKWELMYDFHWAWHGIIPW